MKRDNFDLEQYENDFSEVQQYEQTATDGLKRVEGGDSWEPTEYKCYYLPRLRLAGIKDKNREKSDSPAPQSHQP